MQVPTVNGVAASLAIKCVAGLLVTLIVAITIITVTGKEVPQVFAVAVPTLLGFVVGSRFVTDEAIANSRGEKPGQANEVKTP